MHLFGAPGLVRGADAEILPLQPKRAAVLTYLVVARPGPLHRRDTLLALFWPEHSARRGRNALSKVIHHLGRSLPPGSILTQDDQIGIAPDRLWCDVRAFEQALESGRAEEALSLYGADLLEGFHIAGSPDFDLWADAERRRLRRRAVASAWDLASEAEQAGDGPLATALARRAVEWAPRDESALRRFLTLLYNRGNRGTALEAFEMFAGDLRRDFGVDPSAPTLELIEAIRDGTLPKEPVPTTSAELTPGRRAVGSHGLEPWSEERAQEAELTPTPQAPAPGPTQKGATARRPITGKLAWGVVGVVVLVLSGSQLVSTSRGGVSAGSVLVTEFEEGMDRGTDRSTDEGTDEGLGAAVSEALRIDLAQSRAFDLVDPVDIGETLELMGRRRSAAISAEVGHEVAARSGIDAFVEGAVLRAGTGYILTAAIRAGSDGRTIASLRESVTDPDQMIESIDHLSRGIREALGEELQAIQAGPPLERVTTSSLEALTLYSRATTVFNQNDDRSEAATLLQRAVALDPGFAMAWRMLATAVQNDSDQSLRLEASRQAFHHRDRLSELERYTVEASYYAVVEGDRPRAAQALLRTLAVDPDNVRALNNLGINYVYMGDLERAEDVFRRLVARPGVASTAHRNLVDIRTSLGRKEEASLALGAFERAYPDHRLLPQLRVRTRFLLGEAAEAKAEAHRVVEDLLGPAERRANMWTLLGRMAYWEGRFEDGRRALLEAERVDRGADEAAVWTRVAGTAHTAALLGDGGWARGHIETRLVTGLPDHVLLDPSVAIRLVEVSALTSANDFGGVMTHAYERVPRLATAYARIQAGDTVGLRAVIEELPLHLFQRALLSERLGDLDETIELLEEVTQPGYTGWGNTPERLRALIRLGPLYEAAGDTARAVEAYMTLSEQWAGGDRRGRGIAEGAGARARALQGERAAISRR